MLNLTKYIEEKARLKESGGDTSALFVFRQKYQNGDLMPDLTIDCLCRLPINPDADFIRCDCQMMFHKECLRENNTLKCSGCNT